MELIERRLVPVFILGALVPEVVALCCRNWIQGYYGDVAALTLCPWRLCLLNCLHCSGKKPTMGCFWIEDWYDTGFETFGVVAHLEYWCLALLTVGLLIDILAWMQTVIRIGPGCPLELHKPAIVVLIAASVLSTLSVSLFGAKIHQKTSKVSNFDDIRLYFDWPYVFRLAAGLMSWAAAATAIWCQYRLLHPVAVAEDADVLVDPRESADEAENGALL